LVCTGFAGYCLLFFAVAFSALWRGLLFFGRPKKSNQKKGRPVVAFRYAKSPVLLALAGLHRQAIHGLAMKASAPASPASRQFPAKTAMLGATKGDSTAKPLVPFSGKCQLDGCFCSREQKKCWRNVYFNLVVASLPVRSLGAAMYEWLCFAGFPSTSRASQH